MNRESLGPAVIAVVCAVAVVFAAATLTSTVDRTGGEGVGGSEGGGVGGDEGENVDLGGENDTPDGLVDLGEQGQFRGTPICIHFLNRPEVILGIVATFLVVGYLLKRRLDALSAVGVTTSMALPVFFVWMLLTACDRAEDGNDRGLPEILSGRASGGGGSVSVSDPTNTFSTVDVPIALLAVVAVGLLVVLAITLSDRDVFSAGLSPTLPSFGGDDGGDGEDQAPVFGADPRAVGRVAGRAADRIEEDADVENEVYRAWVEMTRHLEVDHPESSTPAEFADAAVEAGMAPDDVEELTELFEVVRYGGHEATVEREERAVRALRRIESAYAGDGS